MSGVMLAVALAASIAGAGGPAGAEAWQACEAELVSGARADALAACRAAVDAERSPRALAALATALVDVPPGERLGPADSQEANLAAQEALSKLGGKPDRDVAYAACFVALRTGGHELLHAGVAGLQATMPGAWQTRYFAAIDAANAEEWSRAREELDAARAAGLAPAPADDLLAQLDARQSVLSRYGWTVLAVLGGWVAVLGALALLGLALSAATLRAAGRLTRSPAGTGSPSSRVLRQAYRVVLWATCLAYYASLPLVLAIVVACGYGVFWGLWNIGHVPVAFVGAAGLAMLATVVAILKSVWISLRPRTEADPGPRVEPGAHAALDRVVRTVAERVGTRPVDVVFLLPGTEIGVFERGGLLRQLADRSERCLVLGVGALAGLTQGELKAILAHEYGHLVNRDTAGGRFALTVRRSVQALAKALVEGGGAAEWNPAWWFVQGFSRLFVRVSHGASRLQEILADRWAALACGGTIAAAALERYTAQQVRFERHVSRTLREVVEAERALPNLYRHVPEQPEDPAALAAAIAEALDAPPSPYDSHPATRDRIAWSAPVRGAHPLSVDDASPAWSLFADREAVERELTTVVRAEVAWRRGVTLPAEASPEAADGGVADDGAAA